MGPGSFDPGNVEAQMDAIYAGSASMGPGSFDPGNETSGTPTRRRSCRFNGAGVFRPRKYLSAARDNVINAWLQWGRGLSTPEIPGRLRRKRRLPAPLQWGRGLSTPEMANHRQREAAKVAASMGPGSFDPGNLLEKGFEVFPNRASMGPGSFDPGNMRCGRKRRRRRWLQWGRGLSTPEIGCRSRGQAAGSGASMGPGSFDPGNAAG